MEHLESRLDTERLLTISHIANAHARDTGPKDAAEDIAQDVTLHCLIKLRSGELPTDDESIAALVRQMVRCRVIDDLRRRSRRAQNQFEHVRDLVDSVREWMQPDLGLERGDLDALHERTVASLPPLGQRVFMMVSREGSSYDRVAQTLGISRWTVSRHLSSARQRFQLELKRVGIRIPRPAPKDRSVHRRPRGRKPPTNSARNKLEKTSPDVMAVRNSLTTTAAIESSELLTVTRGALMPREAQ